MLLAKEWQLVMFYSNVRFTSPFGEIMINDFIYNLLMCLSKHITLNLYLCSRLYIICLRIEIISRITNIFIVSYVCIDQAALCPVRPHCSKVSE